MMILENASDMRKWSLQQQGGGKSIGFVPTMGALHLGHASLLQQSVVENDATVLSIFVNPTQFGPNEDFEKYPRTFESDLEMATVIGVDAIYLPDARTMYPKGYATYVNVERLTEVLCGASRPGHFRGVTTVVTKLFNAVLPSRAYFGQKDAQQCAVIKRMVNDLDGGVTIVEMPIVRESDGLALSSRNRYLSIHERERALCINHALQAARAQLEAGEREPERIVASVRAGLQDVEIDYVELVDAADLTRVSEIWQEILLAVAVHVGSTRLIDNLKYDPETNTTRM